MAVLGRSRPGPPPLIKSWIRPWLYKSQSAILLMQPKSKLVFMDFNQILYPATSYYYNFSSSVSLILGPLLLELSEHVYDEETLTKLGIQLGIQEQTISSHVYNHSHDIKYVTVLPVTTSLYS